MTFPPELLYNVVKYTSINEVRKVCISLCPSIDLNTLQSIEKQRKSPEYVFSSAFENVSELTKIMSMSDTALSGFHAFSYFVPINIKDSDTWEFYCDTHPLSCLRFIRYLDSIGVKWLGETELDDVVDSSEEVFILKGYKSQGKGANIHVRWLGLTTSCYTGDLVYDIASTGVSTHDCAIWGNRAQMPTYSKSLSKKGNVYQIELNAHQTILNNSKDCIKLCCDRINSRAEIICNRYKENGIVFSKKIRKFGNINHLYKNFRHASLSINFSTVLEFERPQPLCVKHMALNTKKIDTYEKSLYELILSYTDPETLVPNTPSELRSSALTYKHNNFSVKCWNRVLMSTFYCASSRLS